MERLTTVIMSEAKKDTRVRQKKVTDAYNSELEDESQDISIRGWGSTRKTAIAKEGVTERRRRDLLKRPVIPHKYPLLGDRNVQEGLRQWQGGSND